MADPGSARTPEQVIRSYYLIAGIYSLSASLIWGVNTLFLLDAGLDILGVFIANGIFTAAMAAFEIPTGVLADTSGRRTSFLLSVVVVLVGTIGYVGVAETGGSLLWFSIWSIVLGLGYTFYSGAVEAWLVDALHATGYDGPTDRVFARGSMVTGAAMLVGTVGGGVLGTFDLSYPFIVRAGLLAGVFVVAFVTMHDLGFSPRKLQAAQYPREMASIARSSIKYGWQRRSVRLLVIAGSIQALLAAWGFHSWQPYFLELLGSDAAWVAGVIAALVALAAICGNSLVEVATRYCGKRTTLLVWSRIVYALCAVGVGLVSSFWLAVGLYLVAMLASGVYGPVKQAYLHQIIPSEQRATVVSFDSLMGSGGSATGQLGLGYLARTRGIASGYVLGGLTTLFAVPVLLLLRRMGEDADKIIGTGSAGKPAACAAQGLPDVASVDNEARTSD